MLLLVLYNYLKVISVKLHFCPKGVLYCLYPFEIETATQNLIHIVWLFLGKDNGRKESEKIISILMKAPKQVLIMIVLLWFYDHLAINPIKSIKKIFKVHKPYSSEGAHLIEVWSKLNFYFLPSRQLQFAAPWLAWRFPWDVHLSSMKEEDRSWAAVPIKSCKSDYFFTVKAKGIATLRKCKGHILSAQSLILALRALVWPGVNSYAHCQNFRSKARNLRSTMSNTGATIPIEN